MTSRKHLPLCLIFLFTVSPLVTACGKKKSSRPSKFPASTLYDFKSKGLELSAFKETDPQTYGAEVCQEGQVEGLAVLLCRFTDANAAKQAESKLNDYVQGAVTGLMRVKGKQAMVVADPDKMDLRGKTIARLAKIFGE